MHYFALRHFLNSMSVDFFKEFCMDNSILFILRVQPSSNLFKYLCANGLHNCAQMNYVLGKCAQTYLFRVGYIIHGGVCNVFSHLVKTEL